MIIAEGAPSESFIDDDSRGMFHNAHEYRALYPDAAGVRRITGRRGPTMATRSRRCGGARARAGLPPQRCRRTRASAGLRGYVDRVTPHVIEGWAQNVGSSRSAGLSRHLMPAAG